MLAKKRLISLNGAEVERTPLLVPSFSSKGFPEISNIIKVTEQVIEGPTLVSAYDIHNKKITPPFDFASLIFLDSGGYEASKDAELSDFGEFEHEPKPWTQQVHEAVLEDWKPAVPSVIISYDHPDERLSIKSQIERARSMAAGRTDLIREILIKPESGTRTLLSIENIIEHIDDLTDFDIIGFTEKEIGNSVFSRMINIAKIRLAVNNLEKNTAIHIFGSLDTITTPLYFLSGADIFDGLTWIRFAYHDGYTMYKHNYGAIRLGVKTKAHIIDGRTWFDNYRYLVDLELEMRRFLKEYDFSSFKHHSSLFKDAHESMIEAVGAY